MGRQGKRQCRLVVALLKISIAMGKAVIVVIYSVCVAESNKMLPVGLWSLLWNSGNEYVAQCCWQLARVGLHFWETGCGCTVNISILLSTHINRLLKVQVNIVEVEWVKNYLIASVKYKRRSFTASFHQDI